MKRRIEGVEGREGFTSQAKKHAPERIITKLRELDAMLALGMTIGEVSPPKTPQLLTCACSTSMD